MPAVSAELVCRHERVVAALLDAGARVPPSLPAGCLAAPHLTLATRSQVEALPRIARRVYEVLAVCVLERAAVVDTSSGECTRTSAGLRRPGRRTPDRVGSLSAPQRAGRRAAPPGAPGRGTCRGRRARRQRARGIRPAQTVSSTASGDSGLQVGDGVAGFSPGLDLDDDDLPRRLHQPPGTRRSRRPATGSAMPGWARDGLALGRHRRRGPTGMPVGRCGPPHRTAPPPRRRRRAGPRRSEQRRRAHPGVPGAPCGETGRMDQL